MKIQALLLASLLAPVAAIAQETAPTPADTRPSAGHIDPLGGAHGSADPHAALSADQNIKVALQHRTEGRLPEAIQVMEMTLLKYPTHAQSHAVMADLYREKGQSSKALASIEKAIKLDDTKPLYYVSRALYYMPFQRFDEALADLNRAVELDGDLIAARFNRGSLYAQNKHYEDAIKDFDHCIAVDPHLPAPYFNRGSIRYSLGLTQLAVQDIERFIELSDNENWVNNAKDLLAVWEEREKRGAPPVSDPKQETATESEGRK